MIKVLKYTASILIIFVLTFYFWGSSGSLTKEQLIEIVKYNSEQETIQKDTFSVVTYNIGYLSGMTNNLALDRSREFVESNLQKAKELISKYNPDFIGFQEIDFDADRSYNQNQMDEIAAVSNFINGAKAVNWNKKYVPFPYWPPSAHFSKIISGQSVLSKYPITSNIVEVLAKPKSNPFYYNAFYLDRLAQICTIDANGETLVVINVHLEAFEEDTRIEHAKATLELFKTYAKDYPVLLIGDFNSIPPFATKRYEYENDITTNILFEEAGIAAAIPENQYLADEENYFTFSSGQPELKIDYIFYNEDRITPIEATVLVEAGQISDHLPVWFRFVLK